MDNQAENQVFEDPWIAILTDEQASRESRRQVIDEMRNALRSNDEKPCERALWVVRYVGMEASELREELVRLWEERHQASHVVTLLRSLIPALGRLGDVRILIEALRDQEHAKFLRRWVPGALEDLGPAAAAAAPALVASFRDKDKRHEASYALSGMGVAAVPALMAGLSDESEWARARVLNVLGMIGPAARAALPAVVELLGDAADNVRTKAVFALGRIGSLPDETVARLAQAMQDRSFDVRLEAMHAIVKIGPAASAAAPALVSLLNRNEETARGEDESSNEQNDRYEDAWIDEDEWLDGDGETPFALDVLEAIRALGPGAAIATETVVRGILDDEKQTISVRTGAAMVVWRVCEDAGHAVACLRKMIQPDVSEQRLAKLKALNAPEVVLKGEERIAAKRRNIARKALLSMGAAAGDCTDLVVAGLHEADVEFRAAVVRSCPDVTLDRNAVVPILLNFLDDPDDDLRWQAVLSLLRMGITDVKIGDAIVRILQSRYDGKVVLRRSFGDGRHFCVYDLIRKLGPSAAPFAPALERIRAQFPDERLKALLTLAYVRNDVSAAIPELVAALNDQGSRPQTAAKYLGEIGPAAHSAVPHLTRMARYGCSYYHRLAARHALEQIDPKTTAGTQDHLLPAYRSLVEQLVVKFRQHTSDRHVLEVINHIGAPMVPALMEKITDPATHAWQALSGEVRGCGLSEQIREAAAVEIVNRYFDFEPEIRRHLLWCLPVPQSSDWSDDATEAVVAFLFKIAHDDDPRSEELAVERLTSMNERVLGHLIKALSDKDWRKRRSAVMALGRMAVKDHLPLLLRMSEDEDERVRVEAAISLMTGTQRFTGERLYECTERSGALPEAQCRAAEFLRTNPAIMPAGVHANRLGVFVDPSCPIRTRRRAAILDGPLPWKDGATTRLLLDGMNDADDPRRCEYARALGKFGNALLLEAYCDDELTISLRQACIAALHDGLQNGPRDYKAACAWALGKLHPAQTSSVRLLIQALDNLLWEASEALGDMGPWAKAAVPALLAAFEKTQEVHLLKALARIDSAAAVPVFAAALHQRNDALPFELAEIGSVEAIKLLWAARDSFDHRTFESARSVFPKLAARSLKVLPALLELLREAADPFNRDDLRSFVKDLLEGVDVAVVYGGHLTDVDWTTLQELNDSGPSVGLDCKE